MLDSNLSWSSALPRTFQVLLTFYNSPEIIKPTFSQIFSSVSFTKRMKRVDTTRCYRVSHWQHRKIIFPTKRLCLPKITALFFQIISTPGGPVLCIQAGKLWLTPARRRQINRGPNFSADSVTDDSRNPYSIRLLTCIVCLAWPLQLSVPTPNVNTVLQLWSTLLCIM
jgi:hypothetical protein